MRAAMGIRLHGMRVIAVSLRWCGCVIYVAIDIKSNGGLIGVVEFSMFNQQHITDSAPKES